MAKWRMREMTSSGSGRHREGARFLISTGTPQLKRDESKMAHLSRLPLRRILYVYQVGDQYTRINVHEKYSGIAYILTFKTNFSCGRAGRSTWN